jgi:two-component system chemotaxis sensor kinase CheA
MNPLLEQFLTESREYSQSISEKLLQLEQQPNDEGGINELFRLVHTLKGNSGLFTFPEMTRVLHAGEDLLGLVRNGSLPYSRELADGLLDALDLVMAMCADIQATERIDPSRAQDALRVRDALNSLLPASPSEASLPDPSLPDPSLPDVAPTSSPATSHTASRSVPLPSPADLPEAVRTEANRRCASGETLQWIVYTPSPGCFFQGEDPFHLLRQTPGLLWGVVRTSEPLPPVAEIDLYKCLLQFHALSAAPRPALTEHFRYVPDDLILCPCELSPPAPHPPAGISLLTAEEASAVHTLLGIQRRILNLADQPAWHLGRTRAVAHVLGNLARLTRATQLLAELEPALAQSLARAEAAPLLRWMDSLESALAPRDPQHPQHPQHVQHVQQQPVSPAPPAPEADGKTSDDPAKAASSTATAAATTQAPEDDPPRFNRRASDNPNAAKSLKVDQAKIDRLMNLIGELLVEKNALPYLAQRAETQYGVRDLAREIKTRHSVIHRIADEMQDTIMQVRMMEVSCVLQRFPRLVRDISRKLGKEVRLVLEGEQTQADKDIIESLSDPLLHIVRNSLDHGLESPQTRLACGKPETGTLTIRAAQEAGRAVIEVIDDGKGIDPQVIKQKAYEKGLIKETDLERIGDQEAVNLIFAAGFSTAEVVSDLSGRGVGMDVVRTAVEKIDGTVLIESVVGKGTRIRLSLPLSMAVTQVMVVESDGQLFGVPMEDVVETVRVPRRNVRLIKQSMTAILRGRVVPLKPLNGLLGIPAHPRPNLDDEVAVLLVQAGDGILGLVVDGFRETIGVIQKRLDGVLAALSVCSGSALLGDGSVLMILNLREML